jgi:hypothetical protein
MLRDTTSSRSAKPGAKVKGHVAKATKDHPQVLVKSSKSRETSAH